MYMLFITLLLSNFLVASDLPALEVAKKFSAKKHLNPSDIVQNPYETTITNENNQHAVCGILYNNDRSGYITKTYINQQMAEKEQAHITHIGKCGTCSSLQDLAVYLKKPDLTKPGKKCAMLSWLKSASVLCFERLGFSKPCAVTWYYNAHHTAKKCFWTCMASFFSNEPSNLPDGSLNACLKCDEEKSGPGFKESAGRTRRNSGIFSSIGRNSKEITHIIHDYY